MHLHPLLAARVWIAAAPRSALLGYIAVLAATTAHLERLVAEEEAALGVPAAEPVDSAKARDT